MVAVNFDKWTVLKLVEMIMAAVCLGFKKATDDEARRLFLYLEKLSREWSLLNNVTWGRVGAAVADASYGGYVIITASLFIGRIVGELPTHRRITEFIFLGLGALLFLVLGSLEFAALDSVPENLVDNAAILGSLTLFTAALFLVDIGGPRARRPPPPTTNGHIIAQQSHRNTLHQTSNNNNHSTEFTNKTAVNDGSTQSINENDQPMIYNIEREELKRKVRKQNTQIPEQTIDMDDGRDAVDSKRNGNAMDSTAEHSPVWSKIKKGQYGKAEIVTPNLWYAPQDYHERHPPRNPSEPGYVQYTAQHWGNVKEKKNQTRSSPTAV